MTPSNRPESPLPPASATKKKRRTWKRRGTIALLVLVCLALIFRVTLVLLLPAVMNKAAKTFKLQCKYDRLDLSLTGGNAAVWNFQLLPQEGGDPIFRADYLQGDISVVNLFRGKLVVYRAAADGVDATFEREANGHIPLLDRFASTGSSTTPAKPAATPTATSSSPMDLQPPLRIDALRLEHVRARVHDLAVTPQLDARLALDLRLSHLGTPGEPTRFELDFSSDPVLDSLLVEGGATGDAKQLTANLHVLMRGLHLKPAQGYLSAIGLHATADDISASMTGQLVASVNPNPNDGIKASLTLDHASLTSDGKEAAALDQMKLDIDSLSPGSAKLGQLILQGVRCNAGKDADGSLAIAGVEVVPAAPQAADSSARVQTAAAPAPAVTSSPFRWSLDKFSLGGLHVGFLDQSVSPPVSLALDSRQIDMNTLDSDDPDSPSIFSVTLTSPGIVREIHIAGQATPLAESKSFKLTATAQGISPSALEHYLNAAGLSSEWKDGNFSVAAEGDMTLDDTGNLTASARLADLHLVDGAELFAIKYAQIEGIALNPQTHTLRAEAIDISGPSLSVHRDADGNLHAFAFKTHSATVNPASVSLPATQPSQTSSTVVAQSSSPFDNFEIGHFAWKDVHVNLTDDAVTPPASISTSDAGITVDNLSIHLKPTGKPAKEGKIRAWLVAPNLASRLSFDGTLIPASDESTCDFNIHGNDIHGDAIAAYLKPLGIEPTLKDGALSLHGKATLNERADQPSISLALDNLKYSDADQSLVSVAAIQVKGLSAAPDKLSLDSVEIKSPHARVLRRADGGLETAGLHFVAKPAPKTQPAALSTPAPVASAAPAPPFAAILKSLKVSGVAIDWDDRAVQPNVQTTVIADTNLSNFEFGPNPTPATLHVAAAVKDSLDAMTVDGTLVVSPTQQNVRLTCDAKGIRGGPAVAYLPPNIRLTLKDGSFHTAVNANLSQNPRGGEAIEVSVNDFNYSDSQNPNSLLQFDSFHLKAPRLDPEAHLVSLDDITLNGLQTNIQKSPAGTDLLGIELVSAPQPAPAPVAPAKQETPASLPPVAAAPNDQAVLRQIATERGKMPLITVQKLNLMMPKITFTDETKPGSAPMVISNLDIRNTKPITLLGRDPESNPQTEIEVVGRIDPIADAFLVDVKASPFTRQKTLGVDLNISGIHGAGLTAIDPELASKIDGRQMTAGQFQASLLATLKLQTVAATDFDFSRGGTLDFDLTNLAFRDAPKNPVLAGIGEIRSDGIVISANSAGVEFKTLEITNLTGRAKKDKDGLHVLGLIVKIPTTQPAAVATDPPAAAPSPPQPIMADSTPPPAPASEIKVDKLLISGIDCRVEDLTADPPVVIPINGLDVEAQDLSNRSPYEDKPIRFNMLVSADKVSLPGIQPGEEANRELFSQIAGSGVVSLYPNPKGWTKLSLSGFELLGVRGIAHEEKLTLGGGTFDGDVDLRFPGDGSIDSSTRLVLTDLALSEPPNGFISHTLRLPAPLDVVIAALQDQDGSITIPLNVNVRQGHLDTASVVGAGVGALTEIIATAVASAPLKLAGLLVPGGKQNNTEEPIRISFPAGYSALGPDQLAVLQLLAIKLQKDDSLRVTLKSDAGRDDVWLAGQRVNPAPGDALVLASALSHRRDVLLTARLDAASQVRALLASTDTDDAARGIERLRTIDHQLADTENAMDYAYDLLRPGADRQAMRRTRAATLAIARARIDSIRYFLIGTGRHAIDVSRISRANPQFVESPENQDGSVTLTLVKSK